MAILIRGIDMPNSLEAKCYYIFGKTGKVSYQDKIVGDAIQVDEEDYERPDGKWIKTTVIPSRIEYKCSICGYVVSSNNSHFDRNYCPKCGSRMF